MTSPGSEDDLTRRRVKDRGQQIATWNHMQTVKVCFAWGTLASAAALILFLVVLFIRGRHS